MATNLNAYTEFKDIAVGARFIDWEGYEFIKTGERVAVQQKTKFLAEREVTTIAPDDRFRVQA